jgi:hypothetical protein
MLLGDNRSKVQALRFESSAKKRLQTLDYEVMTMI